MLEQIYKDFTEKVLPEIGKGLVITKEYFGDLFGRYVKYLIISDAVSAILCLVLIVACIFVWKKITSKSDEWDEAVIFFGSVAVIIVLVGSLIGAYSSSANLIKDLTVPEIRIYEMLIKK